MKIYLLSSINDDCYGLTANIISLSAFLTSSLDSFKNLELSKTISEVLYLFYIYPEEESDESLISLIKLSSTNSSTNIPIVLSTSSDYMAVSSSINKLLISFSYFFLAFSSFFCSNYAKLTLNISSLS